MTVAQRRFHRATPRPPLHGGAPRIRPSPDRVTAGAPTPAPSLDMGDLDRTKRQQPFLAGAVQKLNSAGTFTDPAKLMKLVDTAKQDVVTDEGWDLVSFVKQAKNLSGRRVEFTTLPVERFGRNHGEDINVIDDMKIKRLIAEQIGPRASAPAPSPSDAPGTPPPAAAPAPSASASSGPAIDGGGIPCVD